MATGELESSLRAQMEEYINSRLSGLQEEIAGLQSQVNEAFTRILERSRGEAQTNTEVAATISEVVRAAHERGVEDAAAESSYKKASSEMAILKAGVEDIGEQTSQAGILKTLVNRAASFAPRVAFFVVKNDEAIGWRARGLEGSVGDDAVREIKLPLSADTPLSDVVRSRTTWSGQPGGNAEDYLLLNKLGSEPPQRMVAIPLVARGKTAAVLYADSAALDSDAINLEALETLVRVAGLAVELVAGAKPAAQPAAEQAAQPAAEPSAPPAELAPVAEAVTAPEPEPAEEPQPTEAASADTWEPGATTLVEAEAPAAEPESVSSDYAQAPVSAVEETVEMEAPAVSVEPSIEAPAEAVQSDPSPSVAEQYVAPLGAARTYGRAADATELPVEVGSDEERRLHNDARRFARLLVSEIKLYNKERVEEGRTGGDLYAKLREDIDRSRQMYDKRVAPPVAARYDYFHQELVNTLAEGDAAKLGSAYPGAAA
ncbi:MAG: hypothetical protein QOJ64_260 [Acidobacteriota bacterium]|nr:hypothetical protein [Acidobacteriota bacterium]